MRTEPRRGVQGDAERVCAGGEACPCFSLLWCDVPYGNGRTIASTSSTHGGTLAPTGPPLWTSSSKVGPTHLLLVGTPFPF